MEPIKNEPKKYRVRNYFTQWPIGDDNKIIGENLTLEQAEHLQRESSKFVKAEDFIIEEMPIKKKE